MEELIEGAFKGLLRLASLIIRALVWLVWELWIHIIGWYIGWPVLRVLTFNNFPTESINDHDQASGLTDFTVCLTGFVILVLLGTLLARLLVFTGA